MFASTVVTTVVEAVDEGYDAYGGLATVDTRTVIVDELIEFEVSDFELDLAFDDGFPA